MDPMVAMKQVKDRDISKVVDPTVVAFAPLLRKRRNFIKSVELKTFKYGNTERHQLDVYYPVHGPLSPSDKTPVLFFIYGGGYNTGDKSLSPATFGLVYNNMAAFYATRGFVVIIPDYRLVPKAVFPQPAEDVRDSLDWIVKNPESLVSPTSPCPDVDNVLMMGHSAGAAHIATMLLHPDIMKNCRELRGRIKGIILVSGPHDVHDVSPTSADGEVYKLYWGSTQAAEKNDPLHLCRDATGDIGATLPHTLIVEGEYEPKWILDGQVTFEAALKAKSRRTVKKIVAHGHNHVSIIWAIGTQEGEEWAFEVVNWHNSIQVGSRQ